MQLKWNQEIFPFCFLDPPSNSTVTFHIFHAFRWKQPITQVRVLDNFRQKQQRSAIRLRDQNIVTDRHNNGRNRPHCDPRKGQSPLKTFHHAPSASKGQQRTCPTEPNRFIMWPPTPEPATLRGRPEMLTPSVCHFCTIVIDVVIWLNCWRYQIDQRPLTRTPGSVHRP